jgi:hypothetical protein
MTGTADELAVAAWRTSSYSGANGNCVAVAQLAGGRWAVRDTKDPNGPVLIFTAAEWAAFTAGVRAGEFAAPVA